MVQMVAAMELLKGELLAMAGPQTSPTSHLTAELRRTLQVPFISFSTKDPTLSTLKYSLFIRIAYSDALRMIAITSLVEHFGWKDVGTIYQDDDYGRNIISYLSNAMEAFNAEIGYKATLSLGMLNGA
eukprot:Gb_16272 [translate_table: standard]